MEIKENNLIKRDDNAISEVLDSQDKKDLIKYSLALARGKNSSLEAHNKIFENYASPHFSDSKFLIM